MIDPPNNDWHRIAPSVRAENIDFTTANIVPTPQAANFRGERERDRRRDEDDEREPPTDDQHTYASPPPMSVSADKVRLGAHSSQLLSEAVKGEYRYATLGLVLGLASIVGGVILGLNGVAGSTSWTAKLLGLSSQINDATPGVVLFVVGLFMIVATKPKVDFKGLKG